MTHKTLTSVFLVTKNVFGLATLVPVYFGIKRLVLAYQKRLRERIKKWSIYKFVVGSKLYQWFDKISSLGG